MSKVRRVRLRVRCRFIYEESAEITLLQITEPYLQFSAKDKHYPAQHDGVFIAGDVMFITGSFLRCYYTHRSTGFSNKIYHLVHLNDVGASTTIPPKAWPAIKAAVIAYNEWVESENDKLGNTDN